MPVTSSQTKAIYDKTARSAANRRARLLRKKAASLALRKARSSVVTPTVTTSSPLRVSRGNKQLLQNKTRLASEQEARTRDRITYYENFIHNNHALLYLWLRHSFVRTGGSLSYI
jgi:hypothetical protein